MERRFIKNLRIQKYRGCLDFSISGFEQVNLITGANNSGKSTLLEAVQILASKGSFQTFEKILHLREENLREDEETANTSFVNLFYNFPDLLDCSTPFSISSIFPDQTEQISLSIEDFKKSLILKLLISILTQVLFKDTFLIRDGMSLLKNLK